MRRRREEERKKEEKKLKDRKKERKPQLYSILFSHGDLLISRDVVLRVRIGELLIHVR
jgi:hypothetical protein